MTDADTTMASADAAQRAYFRAVLTADEDAAYQRLLAARRQVLIAETVAAEALRDQVCASRALAAGQYDGGDRG